MPLPGQLNPSPRLLLGPGPSDVHPRVLTAMATPLLGHLDPQFLEILNETQEMLRQVFRTKNALTFPISGTGMAGMEACVVNLIEPGVEQIRDAVKKVRPKVVGSVHAETSTGAWQPIAGLGDLCHESDALLLLDTVTSLGGVPVEVDAWGVDAAYSGTQKCLSCPPGLAPVSFSPRAVEAIHRRKTKVQSWYLDMTMVMRYWAEERFYHHTAPITKVYALREALRIVLEEGLEARFARHLRNHRALKAGLAALGVRYIPVEGHQLPELNAVFLPAGADDVATRKRLLSEFGIEIGGGLGEFKGKAWRIGLMGYNARPGNVLLFLAALEQCLVAQGVKITPGAGVAGANEAYVRVA